MSAKCCWKYSPLNYVVNLKMLFKNNKIYFFKKVALGEVSHFSFPASGLILWRERGNDLGVQPSVCPSARQEGLPRPHKGHYKLLPFCLLITYKLRTFGTQTAQRKCWLMRNTNVNTINQSALSTWMNAVRRIKVQARARRGLTWAGNFSHQGQWPHRGREVSRHRQGHHPLWP